MNQLHTEDLTRSLRERADRIAPAPPAVQDVRRRAAGIRRRRHGAALVAVAASVAIAVGVPVVLTNRGHDQIQPAGPAPRITKPVTVPLDPAAAPRGADPAIPYAEGGGIVAADGARLQVEGDITAFAPLGTGWVVTGTDGSGNGSIRFLDGDGTQLRSTPSDSLGLGVSADGSEVAYSAGGGLFVAWDGGTRGVFPHRTMPVAQGEQPDPVGVVGSAPCVDPESKEGRGCTAYWNRGEGGAFYSSEHGISEPIDGLESIAGVAGDGRIAGQVSHTDDGSCSAVLDQDQRELWRTCDHSLGRFSPGGDYLLAYPAYRDGVGDSTVSVLDAATGRVLVNYEAPGEGFVYDVVWENGEDLIAVVNQKQWHLMRLDVSGGAERVADAMGGDPYDAPFTLPMRG